MANNPPPPSGDGSPNKAPEAPSSPPSPPPAMQPATTYPFVQALQQSYEATTGDNFRQQSVLTPSLVAPSPGLKKPTHDRTVSWGVATSSAPPRMNAPPSVDGTNSVLSGSRTDKLDVTDILNAVSHTEMEAETYILQAVEKIVIHKRNETEVSGLYSQIAEDEINRSKDEEDDDDDDDASEMDDAFDENYEEKKEDRAIKPRPKLSKQVSKSSVSTNASRFRAIAMEKTKGDTVESTLFGITNALKELDDEDDDTDEAHEFGTTLTGADKLNSAAQKMLNEGNEEGKSKKNVTSGGDDSDGPMNDNSQSGSGKRCKNKKGVVKKAAKGVKQEWELFNSFFSSRKAHIQAYTKRILLSIMLPSLGFAFFLFYIVNNREPCEKKVNGTMAPTMAPTLEPTLSPTLAPTEFTMWDFAWVGNASMSNMTTMNQTTIAPNITIAPEEVEEEDGIFGALADGGLSTCKLSGGASYSWWFLFLGVRQVITFSLALITQAFIIDYLALSSRLLLNSIGPVLTLFVVQSKGWPFLTIFWAAWDLVLLSTSEQSSPDASAYVRFVHHWGYWQDWVGLFNEDNSSGDVVSSEWNYAILINAIIVGVAVAVKRLVVGLLLGRQTFAHYGEELSKVLKNNLLVGEIATLARHIEDTQEDYRDHFSVNASVNSNGWNTKNLQGLVNQEADEAEAADNEGVAASAADAANAFIASRKSDAEKAAAKSENISTATGIASVKSFESAKSNKEFSESQQMEMAELLDAWEEPQTVEEKEEKKITIGAVLQFRQALTYMKKKYPFLPAFGPADTREACIDSAQKVYDRLMLRTPQLDILPFETLALLAKKEDGNIDKEKAKLLIRLFRPDRDGSLGKLEFVKSVDIIYKELRLLSANISNSSQMDAAVENLINVVFYIVLVAVIVYRLGEDPLGLFLSFSSVLLAFAFMFGKSSSKYFDGCLFILLQRPYGVGDRMHLSNPQNETSPDGSSGWIVEKVTLFTTSVYWGATNERATLCNGAISSLRVINAARSPNAVVSVLLKFSIDTEYEKIEIFRGAVEQYLKDRPREWLTFVGFRPTEVAPDKGYIGYKIIAQHRNSWQAVGGVIESKANLTTYCLEVAKQLEMRYLSPPLPVSLTVKENSDLAMPQLGESFSGDDDSFGGSRSPPAKDMGDALAAISSHNAGLGLRQRPGAAKKKFADLVRLAMANKDL